MSRTTYSPLNNPGSFSSARYTGRSFPTPATEEDLIHSSLDLSFQTNILISHTDRRIIDQMRDNHPCSLCY